MNLIAAKRSVLLSLSAFLIALVLNSCQNLNPMRTVKAQPLGTTANGQQVHLYTLVNGGIEAQISNYGGIIASLKVRDRKGQMEDVVLGHEDLANYIDGLPYCGAVIGRYANRIADGRFELDGKTYQLATNDVPNGRPCHLHGGKRGFDKRVWDAEKVHRSNAVGLRLYRTSPDGEEGYPGNLDVVVTYWVTDESELEIDYMARTDKPTPINLANHTYFNLAGQGEGNILDHQLAILADSFTPVDKGLIPTGEMRPVKNTPFDFTEPARIGARIEAANPQLKYAQGYDHNWVLNNQSGELRLAASVYEPDSGRYMEVLTTEPGLQFYSGNFMDGSITGKGEKPYEFRYGFCLEPQHYPDSPNQPDFPSTILKPGELYETKTIYRFSTL